MLPHYPCLTSGCCTAACLEGPSVRAEHFKVLADLPAYRSDPEWDPASWLSLVGGGRHVGAGLLSMLRFLIAWPHLSPVTRFALLSLTFDLQLRRSETLHDLRGWLRQSQARPLANEGGHPHGLGSEPLLLCLHNTKLFSLGSFPSPLPLFPLPF